MTMFLAPYTAIADIDGSPLDAGFLFFGEYGKDPELFPIEVFWDADFTVPAAQPIRTRNGYPVRNGSPTKVYLKTAQHSIVIKNRNSAFILVDFKNKGWDASFVVDGDENQRQINRSTIRTVETIADLIAIQNPKNGQVVFVKGYYRATNFALAQPFKGGGTRVYVESRKSENDGFLCINGWVLQLENTLYSPYMAGCKCDGVTDDAPRLDRMLFALEQNEISGTIVFEDTLFVNSYSPRDGKKWEAHDYIIRLVSNVWFDIKGTIKIGSFFDDKPFYLFDGRGFLDIPEDRGRGLMLFHNIKIFGGGIIDGTDAGIMRTENLKRQAIATGQVIDLEISNLTFKGGRYQNTIWVYFLSDRVKIHDCYFEEQYPDGDACHDHSTIYTVGNQVEIYSNKFIQTSISGKLNSACIEVHNSNTKLYNNFGSGYRVFTYIASITLDFEGQDDIRDNILVENNVAVNCMQFFSIWSGYGGYETHKKLGHVTVRGNRLTCYNDSQRTKADFLLKNPLKKATALSNENFWDTLPSFYSFFFVEGSRHSDDVNTQKLLTGDYTRVLVENNFADLINKQNTNTIFYHPRYHNIEHNVEIINNDINTDYLMKLDTFSGLIEYYDFDGFVFKNNKIDYKSIKAYCMQGIIGNLKNVDIQIHLGSISRTQADNAEFGFGALSFFSNGYDANNVNIKLSSTYNRCKGYLLSETNMNDGQKDNISVSCDLNIDFTLYPDRGFAQYQGLFGTVSKVDIVRVKNFSDYQDEVRLPYATINNDTSRRGAIGCMHSSVSAQKVVSTVVNVTMN